MKKSLKNDLSRMAELRQQWKGTSELFFKLAYSGTPEFELRALDHNLDEIMKEFLLLHKEAYKEGKIEPLIDGDVSPRGLAALYDPPNKKQDRKIRVRELRQAFHIGKKFTSAHEMINHYELMKTLLDKIVV